MFDGDAVPDELIDSRYLSSIDPEVVASPPLRRPSGPMALRTLWRMDLTRDRRLARLATPTLVVWGAATTRSTAPPAGRCWPGLMPNC